MLYESEYNTNTMTVEIVSIEHVFLFFYLQLRSLLHAYGVPWQTELPTHPIHEINLPTLKLYEYKKKDVYNLLWNTFYIFLTSINRSRVWNNIKLSLRNTNHQLVHHRGYSTSLIFYQIKLLAFPQCVLCSNDCGGTNCHKAWKYRKVTEKWKLIIF